MHFSVCGSRGTSAAVGRAGQSTWLGVHAQQIVFMPLGIHGRDATYAWHLSDCKLCFRFGFGHLAEAATRAVLSEQAGERASEQASKDQDDGLRLVALRKVLISAGP